jgi:hypothetical protein
MITNTLNYFIEVFGEEQLVKRLIEAHAYNTSRSKKAERRISPITNPVLRFMLYTCELIDGVLTQNLTKKVSSHDVYHLFNMSADLLNRLKPELELNPKYVDQLRKRLLGDDLGGALSAISELVPAAYYKSVGLVVKFPSLDGEPDVDIIDTNFATDAKLFTNDSLRLEAALNESRTIIPEVFGHFGEGDLVVFLRTADRKLLHKSFEALKTYFELHTDGDPISQPFKNDYLNILGVDRSYPSGDKSIVFSPQNFRVIFQASWPLDEGINELKKNVEKSVTQAGNLNKRAITWVMVPNDVTRHSIQMQALHALSDFESFVSTTESLQQVVMFSSAAKVNDGKFNIEASVDIYGPAPQGMSITQDSVLDFVIQMGNVKEIVIRQ